MPERESNPHPASHPEHAATLHLADAGTCPTRLALMGLAMRCLPGAHRAMVFGPASLQREAAAAGVPEPVRVPSAFGRSVGGLSSARRAIRTLGRPGVVHGWSISAAWAATLLLPGTGRIIHLTHTPSPLESRWLKRLMRWPTPGQAVLAVTDAELAQWCIDRGIDRDRVLIAPPAVGPSLVPVGERAALRERWGLGDEHDAALPRTVVVALLSDPPQRVDVRPGALALGLVRECLKAQPQPQPRVALLVHPTQRSRDIAEALMRDFQWTGGMIQEAQLATPWRVLPGCDLAIAHAAHGSRLSALWAMRLGVPLVTGRGGAMTAALAHERDALLADPARPRSFGDRILRLTRDPAYAATLALAAQRHAIEHFTPEAMTEALLEARQSVTPAHAGCC